MHAILRHYLVALILAVTLSACGGGGGDSGTSSVPDSTGTESETGTVTEPQVDWESEELRVLGADQGIPTDFTGCISEEGVPAQNLMNGRFLVASGGWPDPHYRWSVAPGSSLPEGTEVDTDTGLFHKIAGATLVPGAHTFTMRVSDGWNTAEGAYSVTIADNTQDGACDPGTFTYTDDATLPSTTRHRPYAVALGFTVTTGSVDAPGSAQAPFRFRLASGWLPRGLYLDSRTGVLSGTVREEDDDFYQFSVKVTDASGTQASGTPPSLTLWVW